MEFNVAIILFSLLMGCVFTYFYLIECKKNPAFIFLILIFFSAITKQISVFFLDYNPIYMNEVNMFSEYTGASYRLLLGNLLIFVPAALSSRFSSAIFIGRKSNFNNFVGPSKNDTLLIMVLLSLILSIQYLNFFLSSGLPIAGGGVDRWNFWEVHSAFKFLPKLFGKLMIFFPFLLGMLLYVSQKKPNIKLRIITPLLILGYFFFLVISGQKVNGIIAPLLLGLACYLSCKVFYEGSFNPWKLIRMGGIALVVILIFGYFAVQDRGISELAGSGYRVFLYRVFVLTGSAIWTVDYYTNIASAYGSPADILNGMNSIVHLVMPLDMAEQFILKGINISGGLPSMVYYSFGTFFGSVVIVLYGGILGLFATVLYANVSKFNMLSVFLLSYLFFWYISSYPLSSFEKIYDIKFAIFCFLVLLLKAISNKKSINQYRLKLIR